MRNKALALFLLWAAASPGQSYVANGEWNDSSFPIHYEINPAGGPSDQIPAIQSAFQSWDNVSGTIVSFSDDGTTARNGYKVFDRANNISWQSLDSRSILAQTWSYRQGTTYIESDIAFNTDITSWSTNGISGVDVESVALHEIGHLLGLGHTVDPNTVMYPINRGQRNLSEDEIAAMRALYPAAAGVNRPPDLSVPGTKSGTEGVILSFSVTASDPDGDPITQLAVISGLPQGAVFTRPTASNGQFSWTPDPDQAGTYVVTFLASDGKDSSQQKTTITITDTNQAPVWFTRADPRTVQAGDTLIIELKAVDPDIIDGLTEAIVLETSFAPSTPAGVTLGDPVYQFAPFTVRFLEWVTQVSQIGSYTLTAKATDTHGQSSTVSIPITVSAVAPPLDNLPASPTNLKVK